MIIVISPAVQEGPRALLLPVGRTHYTTYLYLYRLCVEEEKGLQVHTKTVLPSPNCTPKLPP